MDQIIESNITDETICKIMNIENINPKLFQKLLDTLYNRFKNELSSVGIHNLGKYCYCCNKITIHTDNDKIITQYKICDKCSEYICEECYVSIYKQIDKTSLNFMNNIILGNFCKKCFPDYINLFRWDTYRNTYSYKII